MYYRTYINHCKDFCCREHFNMQKKEKCMSVIQKIHLIPPPLKHHLSKTKSLLTELCLKYMYSQPNCIS